MYNKFLETIKKYSMIQPNDKIIVGVSGGPDSVALLHLLNSIKDEYRLQIFAVHINHNLRNEESNDDEQYVKELCQKFNILFFVESGDILRISKDKKISLESAGREFRYNVFNKYLKKMHANKIAVAHNSNDNAETILMRIMRGTGLEGLAGIKPIRENIIRPLIEISREEIEEYCKKNILNPRIDSSNLEKIYTRNKIRLELLPYIKKEFNTNIENTLNKMSRLISYENICLNEIANKILNNVLLEKTEEYISMNLDKINKQSFFIIPRVIRIAIERLTGSLEDIEMQNIDNILHFIKFSKTGSSLSLPKGLKLIRSYEKLIISKKVYNNKLKKYSYILNVPGKILVEEKGIIVETEILDIKNIKTNSKNEQYFDYDKIKDKIYLRSRENGDYIYPNGMDGTKKLKDYFIDKKIPREKRDEIPLLAIGNEILWIIGFRTNENYKVNNNTKNVLKVRYKVIKASI